MRNLVERDYPRAVLPDTPAQAHDQRTALDATRTDCGAPAGVRVYDSAQSRSGACALRSFPFRRAHAAHAQHDAAKNARALAREVRGSDGCMVRLVSVVVGLECIQLHVCGGGGQPVREQKHSRCAARNARTRLAGPRARRELGLRALVWNREERREEAIVELLEGRRVRLLDHRRALIA